MPSASCCRPMLLAYAICTSAIIVAIWWLPMQKSAICAPNTSTLQLPVGCYLSHTECNCSHPPVYHLDYHSTQEYLSIVHWLYALEYILLKTMIIDIVLLYAIDTWRRLGVWRVVARNAVFSILLRRGFYKYGDFKKYLCSSYTYVTFLYFSAEVACRCAWVNDCVLPLGTG